MRHVVRLFAALLLMAGVALALKGTALADQGTGDCVQTTQDVVVASLDSPNDTETGSMGDAISDGFFGNEPNLPDSDDDQGPEEVAPGSVAGEVSASAAPGPKTIGGNFLTLGGSIQVLGSYGDICR